MSGSHRVEPPGQMPIRLVVAHPADLKSRCAGTLVPAIAEGATVRLLLLTSGEKRIKWSQVGLVDRYLLGRSHLLSSTVLKGQQTDKAEGGMTSLTIREHFEPFEDRMPGDAQD